MVYIYIGLQFGIFTAIFLFVAYTGGQWLDHRFDTEPAFTIVAVLLSLFFSFRSLLLKISYLEKREKKIEQENKEDKKS